MMAAMMAATIPGMDYFNISIHMGFWAFSYLRFSGLSDHDRRREKLTKELAVSFSKGQRQLTATSSIAHWYPCNARRKRRSSDRVDTMVRYVHGIWQLSFIYMNQTFCLCLLIGGACQWYIQA